jgi:taurine dioxygenase
MQVQPTARVLGTRVTGVDLSQPLTDADFAAVLAAPGRFGVLCFPDRQLDAQALRDFSKRFGRIQGSVTGKMHHPAVAERSSRSSLRRRAHPR